ncbi:DUF7059 domain-containing protein [Ornithinimicrobium sp. W1679]|uniref:DUF7059 domain-containing protein n=1 Tax=Ornithinimicrobium sp. W1679 TaxID=3418770 RepID=UPI003CFAFD5C
MLTADPTRIHDLRADLEDAGYAVDALADLLGPAAGAALHRDQLLPARRSLAGRDEPAALLVRLFVLGEALPAALLDLALPRTGAAGLRDLGLVTSGVRAPGTAPTRGGPPLTAAVDLRPYGDGRRTWWVVSDLSELLVGGPLPTSHVLGVGGASTTLASWTPRPPVDRALDLGTGCGVQALHLSGHARSVVATDVSARALEMARFTAALNDVFLELREGSMLEPLGEEAFDLVVSNPPFVITPRQEGVPRYGYRDGGLSGDRLVADLVGGIGRHLRPGGTAQLLANWELGPGEDWTDHVSGWLEGTGLDAWVVQREVQDAEGYAETWVRDGGSRPGTDGFDRLYGAWLDDFAARGVERVGFGVVTLQRPATGREPWRDLVDVRHPVAGPMGPAVLAGLRARTWLAEHDDDALLDVAWQVADDVTEERVGRPGAPDPRVIQLRQGGGLRRTVRLTTLGAGFVGACDGDLTARQLCAGLAVLTEVGTPVVVDEVLPLLRDLVKDGLLR